MATNPKITLVSNSLDPKAVVEHFFAACSAFNFDLALEYVDDNCVYKNVPFHTSKGKDRIRRDLGGMAKAMNVFEVEMVNIAVNGNAVLTERVDTLGGRFFTVEVPLMGVLIVEDGKITEWRDYFDWSLIMGRMGKSLFSNPFKRK